MFTMNFSTVAEKAANTYRGFTFLPHPVYWLDLILISTVVFVQVLTVVCLLRHITFSYLFFDKKHFEN